jgi:hypothetical protein
LQPAVGGEYKEMSAANRSNGKFQRTGGKIHPTKIKNAKQNKRKYL